jgi:uncharacterized coiled-coil protein SlyX/transposase
MEWWVTDWRDERIAELEAQGAAKDARIAELQAQGAAKDARIATLEQQVAMLMRRVAELEEKLRQNSRNSHLPPSSDSPDERKQRSHDKSSSPRKRGGQPGHDGTRRELLPEEKVDQIVDLYPPECENCWEALPKVQDPCASRYQQTEMPPVEPHTTEWRRHQVTCPRCGYKTRAAHDEKVIPQSPFGPRLMAIIAMITGIYHVSRRSAVGLLSDLLGVRVSLGALSAVEARVGEAVQPAVDEAWEHVRSARVKHTLTPRRAQHRCKHPIVSPGFAHTVRYSRSPSTAMSADGRFVPTVLARLLASASPVSLPTRMPAQSPLAPSCGSPRCAPVPVARCARPDPSCCSCSSCEWIRTTSITSSTPPLNGYDEAPSLVRVALTRA